MKRLRILKQILHQTHSDKILFSYLLFILLDAWVIWLVEPKIDRYFDALWYCYEVISTTGFGELVAVTMVGRAASVLLTCYSLLIIAIVTGVVTNYYTELIRLRNEENIMNFMDRLEHLPELSQEELKGLSTEIKRYRIKNNTKKGEKDE